MKNKNATPVPSFVSRGVRRHNRSNGRGTVDQSRAKSDPMWTNIGGGILEHKRFKETFIALRPGGYKSITAKTVHCMRQAEAIRQQKDEELKALAAANK